MKRLDISPSQFSVTDFINWQRQGMLELNPPFQRRAVWKPGARSYFIDTLVRGLPVPLIFLRERVDLKSQAVSRDVVDGQQRLRTVFSFVDERLVPHFDPSRDRFTVRREHNTQLAGKSFREISDEDKAQILAYRFSVQVLPADAEDRDVLRIFARLNSTGAKANYQELRNAAWFGAFKTTMYDLAYEQLERWLKWGILSEDQIARMLEVELVSDIVINMMQGLSGKSQRVLDRFYKEYDDSFIAAREIERRFRLVMHAIDDLYGGLIAHSSFSRLMHFFTLFTYLYDSMYGLGSSLKKREPHRLRRDLTGRLSDLDRRFRQAKLPRNVLEAVSGAATDLARRKTRLKFTATVCDGKSR